MPVLVRVHPALFLLVLSNQKLWILNFLRSEFRKLALRNVLASTEPGPGLQF